MREYSRKARRIIVCNASRLAVEILESAGVTCILVDDIAAHTYGAEKVIPKDVRVAVLSSGPDDPVDDNARNVLLQHASMRFQMQGSKLAYFEPTIQHPKKNWCPIHLIRTPYPPPPMYHPIRVVTHAYMPMISMLPIAVWAVSNIQFPSTFKRKRLAKLLLPLTKMGKGFIPIDEEYHQEALVSLERVARFSPAYRDILLPFITFCQEQLFIPVDSGLKPHDGTFKELEEETQAVSSDSEDSEDSPGTSETLREFTCPYLEASASHKNLLVSNAVYYISRILQLAGIRCILVRGIAAFQYGVQGAPTVVEVILLAERPRMKLNVATIVNLVIKHGSDRFLLEESGPGRDAIFSYHEVTIPSPKRNSCRLLLTLVQDDVPTPYQPEHLVRVNGYPAVSLLPLVMETLKGMFVEPQPDLMKSPTTLAVQIPAWIAQGKARSFLKACSAKVMQALLPIDAAYHREALQFFNLVRNTLPGIEPFLKPFVEFCQQRLSVPNTPSPSASTALSSTTSAEVDASQDPSSCSMNSNVHVVEIHLDQPPPASTHLSHTIDKTFIYRKPSPHKRIILSNAAHVVINILQSLGIRSFLVNGTAAYEHGRRQAPANVEVGVVPPIPGILSTDRVIQLLLHHDPVRFHVRQDPKRPNLPPVFSYYEPNIAQPKKNWCGVILVPIPNPPPAQYHPQSLVKVNDLPVISMLPVVASAASEVLFATHHLAAEKCQIFLSFLKICRKKSVDPIDFAFHREAVGIFRQLLERFPYPELSRRLEPYITFCESRHTFPVDGDSVQEIEYPPEVAFLMEGAYLPVDDGFDEARPVADVNSTTVQGSGRIVAASSAAPDKQEHTTTGPRIQAMVFITQKVVDALHASGIYCALFGGMAAYLYGNRRPPNDIDILTLPPPGVPVTQESLKTTIQAFDPQHFVLREPRDPEATYRVLYFTVDSSLAPAGTFRGDRCKIDVLVPGTMHLPALAPSLVRLQGRFPVVPFSVLLLHKVQAWDDHRHMPDDREKYKKHAVDAKDVLNLLRLHHVAQLRSAPRPWGDRALFSEEFQALSAQRVIDFYAAYPKSEREWVNLGFD